MSDNKGLSAEEVKSLAKVWYEKLDVHAPMVELLPMLLDKGLEMRFPEGTLRGWSGFEGWYQGVMRFFFDEVHEVKKVDVDLSGDTADVKVVVNWQAHRWKPPAAKSEWLGFDAYQTWVVKRSPETQKPVIATYIVEELRPMKGSVAL
ncbi:MAG: hypothetical protein ACLQMF_02220 [Rectinemataceae bacterium]